MRILHIDTESGFRGGERQVQLLMRGLRDRGIEQALLARADGEFAAVMRDEGFDVRNYPPDVPAWLPGAKKMLADLIADVRPTLLHAHTSNAHSIALAASGGTLPVLVTRRVDFAIKRKLFGRNKYVAPNVRYIAISTAISRILQEGGVSADRITIVPSGIDPSRVRGGDGAALRREWGAESPDTKVIGMVGSYVDHKDPVNLAAAAFYILKMKKIKNLRFVFVGDGPERGPIEITTKTHGITDKVILTGWRDDIADCLAAFDIFVMPSKLEGLCTSLIDAQAVGLPCVATSAGGIPDIITDGENGLLVPPRKPEALADAITRLLVESDLRERLGAAGPAVVERRFTAEAMVEGNAGVYRSILSPGVKN